VSLGYLEDEGRGRNTGQTSKQSGTETCFPGEDGLSTGSPKKKARKMERSAWAKKVRQNVTKRHIF